MLETLVVLYLFYALTIVFLIVPPVVLQALGIHLGLRPGTAITLGGVLLAELLAFGAARAYYQRKGITLGQLGWGLPVNKVAVMALSVGVAVLYVGYARQIPQVRANFTEVSWFKLWGLFVGVAAATIEDIIFRGLS